MVDFEHIRYNFSRKRSSTLTACLGFEVIAWRTLEEGANEWSQQFPAVRHLPRSVFGPNCYCVEGALVAMLPLSKVERSLRGRETLPILDCGIVLNLRQQTSRAVITDRLPEDRFEGSRIAAVGLLSLDDQVGTSLSPYTLRIHSRRILDMDPESDGFGRLMEWPIWRKCPYDDFYVDRAHDFVEVEIVGPAD